MNLYVDIGNQRLKWIDDNALRQELAPQAIDYMHDDWLLALHKAWVQLEKPCCVYLASVGKEQITKRLTELVEQLWQCAVTQMQVKANCADLQVNYNPIDALGVDRYMAMHGAIACGARDVVVVNAGTAVTIDYLRYDNGINVFQGGMIMPGLKILKSGLSSKAAQISVGFSDVGVAFDLHNDSTQGCVRAGVSAMYVHALSGVLSQYADYRPAVDVIISGGDAQLVYAALKQCQAFPMERVKVNAALVLWGMHKLAREV